MISHRLDGHVRRSVIVNIAPESKGRIKTALDVGSTTAKLMPALGIVGFHVNGGEGRNKSARFDVLLKEAALNTVDNEIRGVVGNDF